MGHLGIALECLRPMILASKLWDYCVVWELMDGPCITSVMHWVGCCCCGGELVGEEGIEGKMRMLCRDMSVPHRASTKACEALAKLPSSVLLSASRVHGEAVITREPRWLHRIGHLSNSDKLVELTTTQVLIPVVGGLVELFSSKNVPKSEEIVECFMVQFNHPSQMDMVASESFVDMNLNLQSLDFLLTKFATRRPPSFNQMGIMPQTQLIFPISYPSSHVNFVGSSTDMDEQLSSSLTPQPPLLLCSGPDMAKLKENMYSNFMDKERLSTGQRSNKDRYRSKNLLPERNRRTRIREGILELRSLVPKITKMDITSTLGDAINYIQELEGKVKELRDELNDLSEIDSDNSNLEQKFPVLKKNSLGTDNMVASCQTQASSCNSERQLVEVARKAHVEVNKLGTGDFLIKILWEHKHGSFTRLMEAVNSLGLHVTEANVTSCHGIISNNIRARSSDIQAKKVKEALNKLAAS